jgi:hypothetical protein
MTMPSEFVTERQSTLIERLALLHQAMDSSRLSLWRDGLSQFLEHAIGEPFLTGAPRDRITPDESPMIDNLSTILANGSDKRESFSRRLSIGKEDGWGETMSR